ncbi:TPA: hypothetical protein RQJ73_001708 [Vibrio vulnificus]|nr:hypothetical protein [Vibrio vulnificus]HDY7628453.1 hypothetical protein [Vibrio vulnificus]
MKQCHIALCALTASCLPFTVHAEDVAESMVAPPTQNSPWNLTFSTSYSRNAYPDNSYLASRSLDASLTVKYETETNWLFSANFSGVHQFDGHEGQYWRDVWLRAVYRDLYQPTENLNFSASIRGVIPISDIAKTTDLSTAFRADLNLSYDLGFLLEGLQLTDSVRLRKNFHRYTTAGNLQLEEYRLSNSFGLSYEYGDWWISTTIDSSKSWTYRGSEYSPEFSHAEEIGYNATESFSVAAGLTNSARYFDTDRGPNPIDTLFDLDKPTYYLTLTYNY